MATDQNHQQPTNLNRGDTREKDYGNGKSNPVKSGYIRTSTQGLQSTLPQLGCDLAFHIALVVENYKPFISEACLTFVEIESD